MANKTPTLLFLLTALLVSNTAVLASDRQTEFNDDNYQPRGAINITPGIKTKKTQRKPAKTAKPGPLRSVKWQWEGAGFSSKRKSQSKSAGVFYYQIRNRSINTSSLCDNYTAGSLIYRDCRKAAKRYFNEQCSSQFPEACGAAGMTP